MFRGVGHAHVGRHTPTRGDRRRFIELLTTFGAATLGYPPGYRTIRSCANK
jgi:hypothetical protein